MNLLKNLTEDMRINLVRSPNYKIAFLLVLYRFSSYFAQSSFFVIRVIGLPIRISYRLISEFIYGIELGDKMICGFGLRIDHGVGLVINRDTVIGNYVILKSSTTIGNRLYRDGSVGGSPIIEDHVIHGPNTVIFGDIVIGAGSIIGAGSVVSKNVPSSSVAVGNPARIFDK
jgi:putative colanic acid biosynthesis acetyltransferase WcaB